MSCTKLDFNSSSILTCVVYIYFNKVLYLKSIGAILRLSKVTLVSTESKTLMVVHEGQVFVFRIFFDERT